MAAGDNEQPLRATVAEARAGGRRLNITGGGSKAFYGRAPAMDAAPLSTAAHRGIAHYDPAELVLTARAGTPLAEIEELLAAENQMLGFEPPHFRGAGGATIGGAVASGLAGPRRPYAGALRDFVLGVKILGGNGEVMRFGGEVMKNVAGFDVARLMAGALGTLGVLLEISLRVLPRPAEELTLRLEHAGPAAAADLFNRLAARPLPLSAAAWCGGESRIRLSGTAAGVARAREEIGGEVDAGDGDFWARLRDHELDFFAGDGGLLRVSLPPASAWQPPDQLSTPAAQLLDWGGAQRWLVSAGDGGDGVDALRAQVARHGGHVTRFRHGGDGGGDGDRDDGGDGEIFHPLPAPLMQLHRRLKRAFDPAGIFNPGRLYPDW